MPPRTQLHFSPPCRHSRMPVFSSPSRSSSSTHVLDSVASTHLSRCTRESLAWEERSQQSTNPWQGDNRRWYVHELCPIHQFAMSSVSLPQRRRLMGIPPPFCMFSKEKRSDIGRTARAAQDMQLARDQVNKYYNGTRLHVAEKTGQIAIRGLQFSVGMQYAGRHLVVALDVAEGQHPSPLLLFDTPTNMGCATTPSSPDACFSRIGLRLQEAWLCNEQRGPAKHGEIAASPGFGEPFFKKEAIRWSKVALPKYQQFRKLLREIVEEADDPRTPPPDYTRWMQGRG